MRGPVLLGLQKVPSDNRRDRAGGCYSPGSEFVKYPGGGTTVLADDLRKVISKLPKLASWESMQVLMPFNKMRKLGRGRRKSECPCVKLH